MPHLHGKMLLRTTLPRSIANFALQQMLISIFPELLRTTQKAAVATELERGILPNAPANRHEMKNPSEK